MRRDTARNIALLESKGFETSGANLYAMHHFGALGARKLLTADPNAAMTDVMPPSVIRANPYLRNMTAGEVRRSFELQFGADPINGTGGTVLVKTETIRPDGAIEATAAPRPTPSQTLRATSAALRDLQTYIAAAGDASLDERKFQSELIGKRADAAERQSAELGESATTAQDAFSKIAEQRARINRLKEAPGLPGSTGIGARGVDIPIPNTGVSLSGTIGDLSAAVGQVIGLIPGMEGAKSRANNIADAKAQWESIKSSGLIDTLKEMQAGSKTGATGFGALDKGERDAIIAAYTATDPKKGDAAFIADLTRLDERLRAAQIRLQKQQADVGNPALETPALNTAEEVAAAKAELMKGLPRQPAAWESPQAALKYLMSVFGGQ
jgi:hypothetical protein